MIDNPIYNGDYIAQAKDEINQFISILDSIQLKKGAGQEFEHGNRISMDLPSFPSYSFPHFQKFTDEKLSSANPQIYITDLDAIYLLIQKCISTYCQIIEKQISETEKIFAENAYYNTQDTDLNDLIYFKQAKFCFLINNYYRSKRKMVDVSNNNMDGNQDVDYILDKVMVRELLGKAFDQIPDNNIDIFISHILYFKYHTDPIKKIPIIHLVGVSQRDLIKICKQICLKFNWDGSGRDHLSIVFGKLIYRIEEYKLITYNAKTIRQNI